MLTRSKVMESNNNKNNRSDDDLFPGQTVPPTSKYGPGNLSGDNASVRHPDTLSNDRTLREGPASLGKNDLQDDLTVVDGAPGVAATETSKWREGLDRGV